MALSISPYSPADRETLHGLICHPSLAPQFELLLRNGELDDPLNHPVGIPDSVWVGAADRQPAGFAQLLVLRAARGWWALARIGVIEPFRRRGLGTALLGQAERRLAKITAAERPRDLCLSAWLPSEPSVGFAAHHGFRHSRYVWSMERPLGPVAGIRWPPGIEARFFDGSDRALSDWTDCYNDSFADHFLSGFSTVEEARRLIALPSFRPDGLLLAYRGDRCVGFCRDSLYEDFGEVDVLGVAHEAQGIGLGRALLRWGVEWLQEKRVPHVRLTVDGENEVALKLYRSEGFAVVRTRQVWIRAVPAA